LAYREEELMDSKNSGYETEPQLRSMVCCPYYFHFRGPSAVMTQRIVNLARRYRLILMTRSDVEVPTDILDSGAVIHRRRNGRPGFIHDLVFRLLTWYDFLLIYRKYRFQAVFGIHYYYLYRGFLLKLLTGVRWVVDICDDPGLPLHDYRRRPGPSYVKLLFLLGRDLSFRFLLKYADLVITQGERLDVGMPVILSSTYGVTPDRMISVPNGIDLERIIPLGLSPQNERFTGFYVGYISRSRGLDTVLGAARNLAGRIPSFRLILVGSTKEEDYEWLIHTIDEFGLKDTVDYLGEKPNHEVLRLIEQADVCLYPFPRFPELDCIYPVKIFEYLALGRAVVATRLSGIKAIITDGINGRLVEPGDEMALAGAIHELYCDPALRKRLESQARQSIARFDIRFINQGINRSLEAVIPEPPVKADPKRHG
jgi:glycosyltransferase involved in cell wall biosynthesis